MDRKKMYEESMKKLMEERNAKRIALKNLEETQRKKVYEENEKRRKLHEESMKKLTEERNEKRRQSTKKAEERAEQLRLEKEKRNIIIPPPPVYIVCRNNHVCLTTSSICSCSCPGCAKQDRDDRRDH